VLKDLGSDTATTHNRYATAAPSRHRNNPIVAIVAIVANGGGCLCKNREHEQKGFTRVSLLIGAKVVVVLKVRKQTLEFR
jgi:hypothetical protein